MELNCDMGEGFAIYSVCDDAEMMKHIDIANVACGFHASDPVVMHRTVELAAKNGVRVGAHPSLPDRQGFGRREMKIERDELRDILIYQVSALKGFMDMHGLAMNHIKPHGALYGMAARDDAGSASHTCPMHPEVRNSGPGDCPKCGMALEPVSPGSGRWRMPWRTWPRYSGRRCSAWPAPSTSVSTRRAMFRSWPSFTPI